ncbi:MAG: agmatinase [Candidatus Diapherotrites archaeon]|nr:agmatinase [Candidatus Diapherotrites archaeon]
MDFSYYLGAPFVFGGVQVPFDEADVVLYGVPLDSTSTFKKRAYNAPTAVREASLDIESYVPSLGIDALSKVRVHDLGDVWVTKGDVSKTLDRVSELSSKLVGAGKVPLALGGEHLITLGAVKPFSDVLVVDFDAHADIKDEYMGDRMSHTTVMRRISERVGADNVLEVGVRSLDSGDHAFIKENGVSVLFAGDVHGDIKAARSVISEKTRGRQVYITFDVDVFDAPFVPGTGTPEPGGFDYVQVVELISAIRGSIIGMDVVEAGRDAEMLTPSIAAKTIFELLARM